MEETAIEKGDVKREMEQGPEVAYRGKWKKKGEGIHRKKGN